MIVDWFRRLLWEATLKGLRKRTLPNRKRRSEALVKSTLIGFRKPGLVLFETPSATGAGKWTQRVELLDLPTNIEAEKGTTLDQVRRSLRGRVRVRCSCPDFLYGGFEYILTQAGEVIGRGTNLRPKIRNPQEKGALCKHLYKVMGVLQANAPSITKSVKRAYGL